MASEKRTAAPQGWPVSLKKRKKDPKEVPLEPGPCLQACNGSDVQLARGASSRPNLQKGKGRFLIVLPGIMSFKTQNKSANGNSKNDEKPSPKSDENGETTAAASDSAPSEKTATPKRSSVVALGKLEKIATDAPTLKIPFGNGRTMVLEGKKIDSASKFMMLNCKSNKGTVSCKDIFTSAIVFGESKWEQDENGSTKTKVQDETSTAPFRHYGGSVRTVDGGAFTKKQQQARKRKSAAPSVRRQSVARASRSPQDDSTSSSDSDEEPKVVRPSRSRRSSASKVNYTNAEESSEESSDEEEWDVKPKAQSRMQAIKADRESAVALSDNSAKKPKAKPKPNPKPKEESEESESDEIVVLDDDDDDEEESEKEEEETEKDEDEESDYVETQKQPARTTARRGRKPAKKIEQVIEVDDDEEEEESEGEVEEDEEESDYEEPQKQPARTRTRHARKPSKPSGGKVVVLDSDEEEESEKVNKEEEEESESEPKESRDRPAQKTPKRGRKPQKHSTKAHKQEKVAASPPAKKPKKEPAKPKDIFDFSEEDTPASPAIKRIGTSSRSGRKVAARASVPSEDESDDSDSSVEEPKKKARRKTTPAVDSLISLDAPNDGSPAMDSLISLDGATDSPPRSPKRGRKPASSASFRNGRGRKAAKKSSPDSHGSEGFVADMLKSPSRR